MKTIRVILLNKLVKPEDVISSFKVYSHKNNKYQLEIYSKDPGSFSTLEGGKVLSLKQYDDKASSAALFFGSLEEYRLFKKENRGVLSYFYEVGKGRQTAFLLLDSYEMKTMDKAMEEALDYLKSVNMEIIDAPKIGIYGTLDGHKEEVVHHLKKIHSCEEASGSACLQGDYNVVISSFAEGSCFIDGVKAAGKKLDEMSNKRITEAKNPFTKLFGKKESVGELCSDACLLFLLNRPEMLLPLDAGYAPCIASLNALESLEELRQ